MIIIYLFYSKITWSSLLNQSESLLSSSKGLKLSETANFVNIETSVHVRSNGGGGMLHRPNSILEESLILSSLASINGNSIENGLDSLIESESPSASLGHSLVHLAKNRPKPARLIRNLVRFSLIQIFL